MPTVFKSVPSWQRCMYKFFTGLSSERPVFFATTNPAVSCRIFSLFVHSFHGHWVPNLL